MAFMPIRSVFGRSSYLMPLLLLLATEKIKMLRKKRLSEIICIKRLANCKSKLTGKKKDRLSGMSVSEKVKCIDGNDKKLSISRQCELLQLPPSSYYRPRSSLAEGSDNLVLDMYIFSN